MLPSDELTLIARPCAQWRKY